MSKKYNKSYHYDDSPEGTEFIRIFNKIRLYQERYGLKVIMITSPNISEGKSTTAAYLASTAARSTTGTTVLIDCDLRRPSINKKFGIDNLPGTAEILTHGGELRQFIQATAFPNLKIITAGKTVKSPVELLSSKNMSELIKRLQFHFQTVIVDAPPILPVSDALLLSNLVQGIFLVVKAGSTTKKTARRAVELLQDNSTKIISSFINNMKGAMPYQYDYYSYNYKYYKKEKP